MSVAETPRSQGLLQRATSILLRPNAEWDVIAAEPATIGGLFLGYAAILAAIPALLQLLSGFVPICAFGFACITPNPVFLAASAVIYYAISLAGVFVVGLIIDALAPAFGGQRDASQAMKTAVYSWTAAWLAGILIIIPWLGWRLTLVFSLYSIYLLYAGLPRTMKAPREQLPAYTAVVVVLAVVVLVIGGVLSGVVRTVGVISSALAGDQHPRVSGTIDLGRGASVDLDELAAAGRQAEAQMKAQQHGGPGKIVAVDPERLKALLPMSVAGAARTDISATKLSAAGFGGSDAEATYQNGAARVTLRLTDLGAAGSFAAMASAVSGEREERTATGYKKVSTDGGRLSVERFNDADKSGQYSIIVANRFSIEADGAGVGMDVLKAAVAAIGPERVAALAHG
ncbi:MAG TPA: Yip1 family protein [Caulobacteraceae bacterium]|jgi:hypothetical protein